MEAGSVKGNETVHGISMSAKPNRERDFPGVLSKEIAQTNGNSHYLSSSTPTSQQVESETGSAQDLITLGSISRKNPTVSNLLIKHPIYGKDCWSIIHSVRNRDKPFTRIQRGTTVYLDPKTLEISWRKAGLRPETDASHMKANRFGSGQEAAKQTDSFSTDLVGAVKGYLGKSYAQINCYGLVIRGLRKLGIQYHGYGGLQDKLIRMAVNRGRPINSYLNGEGLVKVSGSRVYSKSIRSVRDSGKEASRIFQEMEPLLEKGFILSFSTLTRGHTGIVSQKNDLWTYINSGDMDHQVEGRRISKGVGEESLRDEIENWFELANTRNEPLLITLGRFDERRLAAFQKNPSTVARQA